MNARRAGLLAAGLTAALIAFAFIGRAVLSADDGAEMTSEALGLLVNGRFGTAFVPPVSEDPLLPRTPHLHSRYGLWASLPPLAFLAPAWPLRRALGASALDAACALTWAFGAALAAFGFLRLARALKPDASPFLAPAFLAGTYLWPYAADSYLEPWAAGLLALSAAALLRTPRRSAPRDALFVSWGWIAACFLRPVVWITVPVLVLAAALRARARRDGNAFVLWCLAFLALGLAIYVLGNRLLYGGFDLGYGTSAFPFVHPLLDGLVRYTVLPGRGVLFYAPVVLASLLAFRKLSPEARLLSFAAPVVLLAVASRWYVWHGGACWGPRFLLPMLPLLAAPAVLAGRALLGVLLGLGVLLNLPGVLVPAGAFQSYAETLAAPASWPKPGGDRTSEVNAMTPLYGHAWLFAQGFGAVLPAPWLTGGARETARRPRPAEYVSPLLLRRALGLGPVPPFVPRLLLRSAVGYLSAGRPAEALALARESLALDPAQKDAAFVAREAESRLSPGGSRP